jgi:myosin-6
VLEWLVRQRWKKVSWATVSCLKFASKIRARAGAAVLLQKVVKMHLARKVHRPRYQGVRQLNVTAGQLKDMYDVIQKLPKNKDKMEKTVQDLEVEIKDAVTKIIQDRQMSRENIKKITDDMASKCNKTLAALQKEQEKQKLAEEAERLKVLPKNETQLACLLLLTFFFPVVAPGGGDGARAQTQGGGGGGQAQGA